ncbi:hypothetical protein B0H14DRAFT_2604944 [Mycena olivaceomarginata]|nr:hypothetical protein B0H14DRAFT_2604944 [Mycena olivaceomarginata]
MTAEQVIPDSFNRAHDLRFWCMPAMHNSPRESGLGSRYPMYLVTQGRKVGIWNNWTAAQSMVSGYPDSAYHGHHTVGPMIIGWEPFENFVGTLVSRHLQNFVGILAQTSGKFFCVENGTAVWKTQPSKTDPPVFYPTYRTKVRLMMLGPFFVHFIVTFGVAGLVLPFMQAVPLGLMDMLSTLESGKMLLKCLLGTARARVEVGTEGHDKRGNDRSKTYQGRGRGHLNGTGAECKGAGGSRDKLRKAFQRRLGIASSAEIIVTCCSAVAKLQSHNVRFFYWDVPKEEVVTSHHVTFVEGGWGLP